MCLWVAANINEALPTILGSTYFQNSILIIIVLRFHTLSLARVGPNNFSFYGGEKTTMVTHVELFLFVFWKN